MNARMQADIEGGEVFICPQCGPAPEGEAMHLEIHRRTAQATPPPIEPLPAEAATAARPKRERKPSKKMQALIDAARAQAVKETLERDRGPEMIGLLVWMGICFAAGVITHAWWPW